MQEMPETDILLLNLEVEAAAARNANLSRQLEQLTNEFTCSTVQRVERIETVSRATQTEFHIIPDAALDLDDLLFEMAEIMFKLYPSTPIDLSSRKTNGPKRVEELAQRCLREMRALKIAWETKMEGYNTFIDELQKGLSEYYRSLEGMECNFREKEAECASLLKDNAELSHYCRELEEQLKNIQKSAESANENITQLKQRTTQLEAEKHHLNERGNILASTVASLRAECVLGPWRDISVLKKKEEEEEETNFSKLKEYFHTPTRKNLEHTNSSKESNNLEFKSIPNVIRACQGYSTHKAFPELCTSADKIVDFCCKMNQST